MRPVGVLPIPPPAGGSYRSERFWRISQDYNELQEPCQTTRHDRYERNVWRFGCYSTIPLSLWWPGSSASLGGNIARRAQLAAGCHWPGSASAGLADEVNVPLPSSDEVNGPFTSRHGGPAARVSLPLPRREAGGAGAPYARRLRATRPRTRRFVRWIQAQHLVAARGTR